MGVCFITCKRCSHNFPDCGEYEQCDNCGVRWCCWDCANEDGLEKSDDCDEYGMYETSCNYCRHEDEEDSILIEFALELLNMEREELVRKFFEKEVS